MGNKYVSQFIIIGLPCPSPPCTRTLTSPRLYFPTDEKEESILGSIPLLSFRVAAVQPSDNISRKHTFKVSWPSSPRSDGGGRPVLLEHRGMERGQEPPPEGVKVVVEGEGGQWPLGSMQAVLRLR